MAKRKYRYIYEDGTIAMLDYRGNYVRPNSNTSAKPIYLNLGFNELDFIILRREKMS